VLTAGGSAGGMPAVNGSRVGAGAPSSSGSDSGSGAVGGAGHALRSERLFLALCLALPGPGATLLNGIDIDELLTSGELRRVGRHLAEHIATPLAGLPADDEEFARTVSGLVELAGRVPDPTADRLEHVRLVLELERMERAIIRARAAGAGTSELARRREVVRDEMRAVVARLETTM
jgi:hypothetical protein